MREILFRGKRKSNGELAYGNFVRGCVDDFAYIVEFGNKELCRNYVEVIPETVGQYTGLTDKNGTKIFEGDIIQSLETKETAVVQWFPEHSAFMVWCKSSNEVGFLYECTKSNIEVIGNIYDNPELLEVSE